MSSKIYDRELLKNILISLSYWEKIFRNPFLRLLQEAQYLWYNQKGEMKMKKIFLFTIITFIFFLSSSSLAGYVIKLKNGRSILTPKCWEEKGEIRFYWANGVAGVSQKDVFSVGKTKETSGEEIHYPIKAAPQLREPEKVPPDGKRAAELEGEKERINEDYYKKQKALNTEKFEKAYISYFEASSRRDEEAKKKAWEEFNYFAGQVNTLEEELKRKNKGILPKWWTE